jgi:PIN domain nuclease of toxin-antitoxin system
LNVLLDTHIWLWWLTRSKELPRSYRNAIDKIADQQVPKISAISLWEAQMLAAKGRLTPTQPFNIWIRAMAAPTVVEVLALDVDVVNALNELPTTFHGDPADRLIVATALAHQLPLATLDGSIRKSKVAVMWR